MGIIKRKHDAEKHRSLNVHASEPRMENSPLGLENTVWERVRGEEPVCSVKTLDAGLRSLCFVGKDER